MEQKTKCAMREILRDYIREKESRKHSLEDATKKLKTDSRIENEVIYITKLAQDIIDLDIKRAKNILQEIETGKCD